MSKEFGKVKRKRNEMGKLTQVVGVGRRPVR